MGVLGYIAKTKEKFRETQRRVRGRQNIRQAKKLQSLRQTRIREEGQAKLRKYEAKERRRIEKARAQTGGSGSLAERLGMGGRPSVSEGTQLKGKGTKLAKGRSVLSRENPYALGPTGNGPNWGSTGGGPSWTDIGSPTLRKKKKKDLWG